jgi:GrpB-like predicted nucleotidyltransferase (UPF0157 family)
MPFPDEMVEQVELVAYQDRWPVEFDALAGKLVELAVPGVVAIDHVGSTSVPGLVAKDVIDVQIRVVELRGESIIDRFSAAGFRRRDEAWNSVEQTRAGPENKVVFAPARGARLANVHVRSSNSRAAHDNLLFREFLRNDVDMRAAWGDFKASIVRANPGIDLFGYGQIKAPAWTILMNAADAWAEAHDWTAE